MTSWSLSLSTALSTFSSYQASFSQVKGIMQLRRLPFLILMGGFRTISAIQGTGTGSSTVVPNSTPSIPLSSTLTIPRTSTASSSIVSTTSPPLSSPTHPYTSSSSSVPFPSPTSTVLPDPTSSSPSSTGTCSVPTSAKFRRDPTQSYGNCKTGTLVCATSWDKTNGTAHGCESFD